MELKTISTVFVTVFLAELGDKTQLATLLFAADGKRSLWAVFLGASLALTCAAGMGVLAGGLIEKYVDTRLLPVIAGVGFIAIGAWMLFSALRG
jgi:putative Ca2+/H+ antiporter (TMEM165/GDT1 family)